MEMADAPRFPACALVDAHVHIHPCFRVESLFDGALENFRKTAEALSLPGTTAGCLLLAEMAGSHWLRNAGGTMGAWTLGSTGEAGSRRARRGAGESPAVTDVQ